jgi:hypothetical protein
MSSMYRMTNGVNPSTFFVLPMLSEKHPDDYPRFRDCFSVVNEKGENQIHVLTRVGGANRNQGFGEEELQKHPNFLYDADEEEDNTYATYVFSIPKEWKEDFKRITEGNLKEISQAYQHRLRKVFPKLNDKFDQLFKHGDTDRIGESTPK